MLCYVRQWASEYQKAFETPRKRKWSCCSRSLSFSSTTPDTSQPEECSLLLHLSNFTLILSATRYASASHLISNHGSKKEILHHGYFRSLCDLRYSLTSAHFSKVVLLPALSTRFPKRGALAGDVPEPTLGTLGLDHYLQDFIFITFYHLELLLLIVPPPEQFF